MKLSKKNQARQRAIAKALASGKALGGLLAGVTAATLAGCDGHPFQPMGAIDVHHPDNLQTEQIDKGCAIGKPNAANENPEDFVTMGEPPAVAVEF